MTSMMIMMMSSNKKLSLFVACFVLAMSTSSVVVAMNKAELIDAIASDSGLSKADSKRALDGFTNAINLGMSVAERRGVYVKGFGAFLKTSNTICPRRCNGKDDDCNGRVDNDCNGVDDDCDGIDDDCNGRFVCGSDDGPFCGAQLGGSSVVCDGINFNPLATAGTADISTSRGVCTGVDDDCDLEVLDEDEIIDKIDFHADPTVANQMGKFYYNYWIDVVMEMANQLDLQSSKSYGCGIAQVGSPPVTTACPDTTPVRCLDGSCRRSSTECVCPDGLPIKCQDGSCRVASSQCGNPNDDCEEPLYKCPDGSCVEDQALCHCGNQAIFAIDPVLPGDDDNRGGRESIDASRNHYEKGDYMKTIVFWMREFQDILDPDSDGDGLDDLVVVNNADPMAGDKIVTDSTISSSLRTVTTTKQDLQTTTTTKARGCCRGHVTVLKARLDDPTNDGVLQRFSRKAGLSVELETFVKEFLEDAIEALEATFDRSRFITSNMKDDNELILQTMQKEILKGHEVKRDVEVRGWNPFDKEPIIGGKAGGDAARPTHTITEDEALKIAIVALEHFISVTTDALKKGDKISLVGFGSFSVSKRAARTGRNPQTGKEIKIAAKNVVRFKAGAELSGKVN